MVSAFLCTLSTVAVYSRLLAPGLLINAFCRDTSKRPRGCLSFRQTEPLNGASETETVRLSGQNRLQGANKLVAQDIQLAVEKVCRGRHQYHYRTRFQ